MFFSIVILPFYVTDTGQEIALDTENAKGLTPLHEAVLSGKTQFVELLVKLGADVNYPVQGNR